MTLRVRASLATLGLFATLTLSNPTTSLAAGSCESTKPLTNAVLTKTALPKGGELLRYQFPPGQANSSGYAGRLTVAKGNLNYFGVTPTHSDFQNAATQEDLASGVKAIVHVNSDFFDFSSLMPYSAIGTSGKLIFAPQGSSPVVGVQLVKASSKTGIRAASKLVSAGRSATITGLNLPTIGTNSIVAYTASFSGSKLPSSTYSIQVSGGRVAKIFNSGSQVKPQSGYLFSATGSSVSVLKKFLIGSAASYKYPSGTIPQLSKDRVTSNGAVSTISGRALATISAVNLRRDYYQDGVVLFTDDYSGATPAGAATVVINSSSTVSRLEQNGYPTSVPNGYKVLQFFGSAQSQASRFSLGMKVSVSPSFSSNSGKKYSTVFGVGKSIITNGVNTASCVGNVDTIRPRTALGWDEAGNVYLATTTMGRDWPDGGQGGYRLGGSTVHQMADWLKLHGATQAVALDGGGSTTMLALLAGGIKRVDLPEGVWIREIPVGLALTSR
ncbi:MAG: hypothetical protein RL166_1007 [Actinomycetota bacterium]